MINLIEGNILDVYEGVICHQVNCKGAFGAGLAKQIADKYPEAKEDYEKFVSRNIIFREDLLSKVKFTNINNKLYIAHLFAQRDYGNPSKTGIMYTDYMAFDNCMKETIRLSGDNEIYVPYGIGCGLGGGYWPDIEHILNLLPRDIKVVKLK